MSSRLGLLVVLLLVLPGCLGYRPASKRLQGGIRTLHIPVFANDTQYSGFEYELTDEIQKEFRQRRGAPLRSPDRADGILEGRLASYTRGVIAFDQIGREVERQVVVTLTFRLVRRSDGAVMHEESLLAGATFRPLQGEGETGARRTAFRELARRLALAVIDQW